MHYKQILFILVVFIDSRVKAMDLFTDNAGNHQTINPALLHTFWAFNEQEVLPPLESDVTPLVETALKELKRSSRIRKPRILYGDYGDYLEEIPTSDNASVSDSDDYVLVLDRNNSKKRSPALPCKKYTCSQCAHSYNEIHYLNRHIRTAHSNHRPFSCDQCQKSFKQKHHMIEHVKRHGADMYFCQICHKGLKRTSELTRHLRDVHRIKKQSSNEHLE